MPRYVRVILVALVLAFAVPGVWYAFYWWTFVRGSGTLEDGAALLREHSAVMAQIVHIAETSPGLLYVESDETGKLRCNQTFNAYDAANCASIEKLMLQIPVHHLRLQRLDNSGMLLGVDIELFPAGLIHRPVDAVWRYVSDYPVKADDKCTTPLPDWRICPGAVNWM